ncbi:glycoside hydrolase family 44 protein [Bdellovibrio reynosensis]|uniref:Glycoside hydrolase family 44 protein n=1 Tax=Bdellovibrio reynosensis TaxID=2835041 RepID=A0ABY4CAN4_9BACT|nr:glycoside hydrolase family 44 protein [Bdellovibrio reynosensis]UOF01834.1 glycoside hydrolase family 44 protein [Bdellovibrio reynosensis]
MKHTIALLISLFAVLSSAHAQVSVALDGQITVDATATNGVVIKKEFYGADTNGFAKLPASEHVTPLHLGYVKFGGNLHSVFNWKLNRYIDSKGRIHEIESPFDSRISFAKNSYNATPMVQVNMLGWQPDYDSNGNLVGMETATAAHAAAELQFLNATRGLGIKHIVMGNEPFDADLTHKVAIPSADEYIAKYIEYAVALRDAQSAISGNPNDVKLWGPEIATGWTGWQTNHPSDCAKAPVPGGVTCSYGNGQFSEFIPYFLFKIASFENDRTLNPKGYKLLDVLTWHYYPLFRNQFNDKKSIINTPAGVQNVAGMLESVNLWTDVNYINKYDSASPKNVAPSIVPKYHAWKNAYYPNVKLACTEFGIDSINDIGYHPIVRPLYLADLIARIGETGVNTFVNSFLQGFHSNDSWAMINDGKRTNLYRIFSMFSNNYLGQVIQSNDNYGDHVNVYSVKTAQGTNVMLVNKDVVAHTPALTLVTRAGQRGLALNLPAWSLTVASIPDNGGAPTIQTFGAAEMNIPVSPEYGN